MVREGFQGAGMWVKDRERGWQSEEGKGKGAPGRGLCR